MRLRRCDGERPDLGWAVTFIVSVRHTRMHRHERPRPPRLAAIAVLAVLVQACAAQAPGATATGEPLGSPSASPAVTVEPTGAPSSPAPTPGTTLPPGAKGIHHVSCDDAPPGVSPPEPQSLECRASLTVASDDVPLWWATLKGPCYGSGTAPDMSLFVACDLPDGFELHGLDPAGQPLPDWPVRVAGTLAALFWNDFWSACGPDMPAIAGAADGTVYVAARDGERVLLHAFSRDGSLRDGWPRQLPGDPGGICAVPGFSVAEDGSVRTWGYEGIIEEEGLGYSPLARRTIFSALGPDGRTLDGWPIGSTGTASGPLIGADGTLYYVSATGRVWAHDTRGEVKAGWPYLLPELTRPYLTSDGRLFAVLSDSVVALTASGSLAPGWPYVLPGPRQPGCFAEYDTDCFGVALPALAADGTLYVALEPLSAGSGSAIVALDAQGSNVPGWPYELPANTYATSIEVLPTGWIALWPTICDAAGCQWTGDALLLTPEGEPVY